MANLCIIHRLCSEEIFCSKHRSVFRDNPEDLRQHASNRRSKAPSLTHPVNLTVSQCKEMIQNMPNLREGQEWKVLVPLRELILTELQPPIPQGGRLLEVAVCRLCLAVGNDWIALQRSYTKHRGTCHPENSSAKPILVMAQKVRDVSHTQHRFAEESCTIPQQIQVLWGFRGCKRRRDKRRTVRRSQQK